MAGEGTSRTGDSQLLCVIHCHEGELKVSNPSDASAAVTVKDPDNCGSIGTVTSGSQSPR